MKKDWTYKKFADLFNLNMGKTPARANEKYWTNGKYPWVAISDLSSNKYISHTKEQISQEAIDETNIHLVPKGTVIMSFKLSIGKTAITPFDLYTNEAIMAFEPKTGIDVLPDFLYYYLQHYPWSGNRAVKGETINKALISNSYACIPPLVDQELIVRELDAIHGILEKKQEQLRELDHLAQTIFYDMFGDPITNPKQWEVKKFSEAFHLNMGKTPARADERYWRDGIHPWVSISDLSSGETLSQTKEKISQIAVNETNIYLVPKGTVIMSFKLSIGKTAIVPCNLYTNEAIMAFEPKEGIDATSHYLYHYLQYYHWTGSNRAVKGETINKTIISNSKAILPPLSLQQSFAAKIEAIEAQKTAIRQSIREAETLIAERMDHYFN